MDLSGSGGGEISSTINNASQRAFKRPIYLIWVVGHDHLRCASVISLIVLDIHDEKIEGLDIA